YAAIHGLPDGTLETTREDWRGRVHTEDLPQVEACQQRVISSHNREHSCEYRIVRPNGEIRWIEARCSTSYDARGDPRRVMGTNIDITERKQTEASLEESKIRLADALTAGQVMAFQWDAITGQSVRSGNAALMLGYEQAGGPRPSCTEFLC